MTTPRPISSRRALLALCTSVVAAMLTAGCASNHYVAPQPMPMTHVPDANADLHIAESALEAGDTQLALSLFDKLLRADPQSRPAQLGLADTMYQTGDLARAGVLYARVAASAPEDPRTQLGLARIALRERHLDEAEQRYRKLLSAYPDNAVAAEGLGATLDLLGRHDEAQVIYRAALERHPEVHGLKANLGLSLALSGKARAGANVLLDIASLPDAPPQARENLALAYGVLGNGDAAKRILSSEMPAQSAEDNLRFYRDLRERLTAQASGGAKSVQTPGADSYTGGAIQ